MRKTIAAAALAASLSLTAAQAQTANPAVESHLVAAKAAAGLEWDNMLGVCLPDADASNPGGIARASPTTPPRAEWYARPQKVFDNLYWVGTKIHSSWVLKTSQGLIVIDTLYAYAVEPEIVDGLKALGLDPKTIKYVIVSHGHGDHDQGARLLQDRYGAHVIMGAPDWDVVAAQPNMPGGGPPKRDMTATDGQKLTLGDTTVTIYTTPGHTLGTLSLVFPVKEHGRPLTVAYSGGTAFNFRHEPGRFDTYIASQRKMQKVAAEANATVLLSNHSLFDSAYDRTRLAGLPRSADEPHPLEVGADATRRYFKVLEECAIAVRTKEFGG
ncbi:MBL fold metallo-hydrolase [Phenylobacterium sp.]|jgi:metallo-beta-lactamase class B|uniref:MBL fold metallo-hydrolase n=1 Tax=Phenylobacterium sp. TaxID=1871053 RepID=UPI002E304925|nr:MBL fold metallo-hydrolase [Phenylobacterium sp.]HEX3364857.1 MBL fold metallo-hydrolase [Phenylobacterium sp.]